MNKLTIDEVIESCKENVNRYDLMFSEDFLNNSPINAVREYWEYKLVAEWLEELKEYRKLYGNY